MDWIYVKKILENYSRANPEDNSFYDLIIESIDKEIEKMLDRKKLVQEEMDI